MDTPSEEAEIWNDLRTGIINDTTAVKALLEARESGVQLTSRSTELLSFESNAAARAAYVSEMKQVQYVQQTLITCMEPLKKDSEEIDALTLIVVGTESGHVMILPLDPNNSAFLCRLALPSAPVLMSVSGIYDVEWRVTCACRDGKMYTMKNGDVRGSAVLVGGSTDLGAQAVALARQDKSLWVATMDKLVSCYTARGKRTKVMVMPDEVTEMCVIPVKRSKVGHLLLVALASGALRMYKEAQLVHTLELEKPIIALRFGSYGREDGTLVAVHGQGSLTIKIWRRLLDVDAMTADSGPPPEQDIPLPVPKKTKLYVEQTQRERDNAADIHRAFQRDLCRMRLETARAYVKTLSEGHALSASGITTGGLGAQDVRVQVQVQGLGPKFLLKITLQNSGTQPVMHARLLFSFDSELYVMGHDANSRQCIVMPLLLPGPKHTVEAEILSVDPQGRAGAVLLLLHAAASPSALPMLSATIRMPASELLV